MPVNDDCSTAINLTVGICQSFNDIDATPSNNPSATLSCGFSVINVSDTWFTVVVPASGNLSIQSNSVNNPQIYNSTILQAYSGQCSNLQTLACSYFIDNWNNQRQDALIELENLVPGSIIYVRAAPAGNSNYIGDYDICVTDSGHTTHGCKIQYVEAGSPSVCNPTTNTFSQEITVYYYDDGSSDYLSIFNQNFPLTPSPMTVQITDLAANNIQKDLTVRLSANIYNECFVNSEFSKPQFFSSVNNCFSGAIVNDDCSGAIELNVSNTECIINTYNMTGATTSILAPNYSCNGAAINPQDVWFKMIVPDNGELVVSTDLTPTEIWSIFELYEGSCGNLNSISSCGGSSSSIRLFSRTPGEIIFMRVSASSNFTSFPAQGLFSVCALQPQVHSDICQDAVPISISSECNTQSIYTTHFAVAEGLPTSDLSCSSAGRLIKDIWVSIEIPQSGDDVSLIFNRIYGSFFQVELFESNCASLNSLDCAIQNNSNDILFDLINRSPGEVLHLRISATQIFTEAVFRICATSECPDKEIIQYPIDYAVHIEDHISIEADNIIENTANVVYDAGQYVLLHPGFEVEPSGIFHAYIDGCN